MYENAKSLPDELRTDEIFVRVLEELEHVNADERMRAILEQRDKEERTRITELNAAEKRGLEKGREEERLDVARKMLAEGFDISLIAKMTDMSVAEIEKIKAALSSQHLPQR